jgi:hypothetical protein
MRKEEEIKANLDETLLDLKDAQDWANSAYERYNRDRKDWGYADPGEMYAANDAVAVLTSKVNALNWVLEL